MNPLSSGSTRLLIRPEHEKNESLRGYVSRVSSLNGLSPILTPLLKSLQATTDAIEEIATLTGCHDSVLKKHGSYLQVGPYRHSGVLFGSCVLSIRRVWSLQRMICPMCLSKNGISTCCWELRDYDVCHEHGCFLVGTCSRCARRLTWASTFAERCSCGIRLADIETGMAPTDRVWICKLLADEMSAITAWANQTMASGSLTLYLFFIVRIFVRSVLIPGFAQEHLGARHLITKKTCEKLFLVILKDSGYYDYLRRVILLYTVENPLTIRQASGIGFSEKQLRDYFRSCLRNVIPHSHMLELKAKAIQKRKFDFQPAPESLELARSKPPESHRFQVRSTANLVVASAFSEKHL